VAKRAVESIDLLCSFCSKSQHEVRKLIAGPHIRICDECVELCNDIIADERDPQRGSGPSGADARDVSKAIQWVAKELRSEWVIAAPEVVGRLQELAVGLDKVSGVIDVRLLPSWPPQVERLLAVSRALSSAATELRDQAPATRPEVISSIRELADRVDALAAKLPTLLGNEATKMTSSDEATSDREH
jgi:hypothetical protein